MHDCNLEGGHFFVHTPTLRTFTCQRCRAHFPAYNPPISRTPHHSSSSLFKQPAIKAPWRCILEKCQFTACEPCACDLKRELERIKEVKDRGGDVSLMLRDVLEYKDRRREEALKAREKERERESARPQKEDVIEVDDNPEEEEEDFEWLLPATTSTSRRPVTRSQVAAIRKGPAAAAAAAGSGRRIIGVGGGER